MIHVHVTYQCCAGKIRGSQTRRGHYFDHFTDPGKMYLERLPVSGSFVIKPARNRMKCFKHMHGATEMPLFRQYNRPRIDIVRISCRI